MYSFAFEQKNALHTGSQWKTTPVYPSSTGLNLSWMTLFLKKRKRFKQGINQFNFQTNNFPNSYSKCTTFASLISLAEQDRRIEKNLRKTSLLGQSAVFLVFLCPPSQAKESFVFASSSCTPSLFPSLIFSTHGLDSGFWIGHRKPFAMDFGLDFFRFLDWILGNDLGKEEKKLGRCL